MNTKRLTNSEKQIMEVLWKSDVPLSSHDIILSSSDKTWKNSSVHLLLNSLLDKELIEVAGFEKRTKNYARVFKPTLSYVDYILTVLTKNSDKEKRAELIEKKHNVSPKKAAKIVEDTDLRRRSYHNYYTGEEWGNAEYYDICIDVSKVGEDGALRLIEAYINETGVL